MGKELYWTVCLNVMLITFPPLTRSQGSVCASFGNISQCSRSSTWAVNAYPLLVTHVFEFSKTKIFRISYHDVLENFTKPAVCVYNWEPSVGCYIGQLESNCVSCTYNVSASIVKTTFNVSDLYLKKNQSNLRYFATDDEVIWIPLLNITVSECPKTVGSAVATKCSEEPCGYNCECQFRCPNGFTIDAADSTRAYKCNALAQWTPDTPTCKPDLNRSDCASCKQECGIGLTVAGSVLIVVILFLTVYMALKPGVNLSDRFMIILYAITLFCVIVWVVSLCLCFRMRDSQSSYVTGSVLGAAGITGMAVLTVLFFMQLRTSNDKGIKGKAEEMVPMNT